MKIGLFVDINNLYYNIKNTHGKKLDYSALIDYCNTLGDITVAKAYGSKTAFSVNFDHMLKKLGFIAEYKDPKPVGDGVKCDWGVGITLDVIENSDAFDVLVLCSGDGELVPLLKKIECKAIVLACNPSDELRKHAYSVLDIPEALLCDS